MKVRLPKSDYETVKKLMYEGGEITEDLADVVAQAMKEWALEKVISSTCTELNIRNFSRS